MSEKTERRQAKSLLEGIDSPADLKRLPEEQLPRLCGEIRSFLIEHVSRTGGHLASNLGVVELSVALHRVFDSPQDQIVWDVGHQSYTHKLLTGRRERFDTLRCANGLAGFCRRSESEHDAFISGHSGISISAAFGLCQAKRIKGEPGHVVAVIGDGSFTNGEVFEGINNAGRSENSRLIVVLNDNEMSISKNVGSFARYLARIRSKPVYYRFKDGLKNALIRLPLVGDGLEAAVARYKAAAKNSLYHCNFFEEFGFSYLGPVDGHDLAELEDVLRRARQLECPVLVHVETRKGKGYSYAEENPGEYHGVSRFDIHTGQPVAQAAESYSEVFGRALTELAAKDNTICAVTAAMKYATGLNHFSRRFKNEGRFFDVGISEGHALTFSAALATKGLRPVFAVYSSFAQRAFDQMIHDAAIERTHLVLAIDRAGIVGEDGETHQGIFDLGYLSLIPGVTVYSPASYTELRSCLQKAIYERGGLCAVRYPRGAQPDFGGVHWDEKADFVHLFPGNTLAIVTYGRLTAQVFAAANRLRAQGIDCAVCKLNQVTPLPEGFLEQLLPYRAVLIAEEVIRRGGLGETIAAQLLARGYTGCTDISALESFVPPSTVAQAFKAAGFDSAALAERGRRLLARAGIRPASGQEEGKVG